MRRLARRANRNRHTSLFSLLLRLEKQIDGGALAKQVLMVKSEASVVFSQRLPILAPHSRYVE
jgi:hypothetical protein